MKRLKKIALAFILISGLYLVLGYFLHLIVFPEYKPDLSGYFQPGDIFYSQEEGLKQTVIKQENGRVYVRLDLDPHAPGPPMHIHNTFDELFEGGDKPVKLIVNKEVVLLNPGEKLLVPKGVPHKMLNDSDAQVSMYIMESGLPEGFAVYLNQVYGYMDESPDNMKFPKVIFQMAMFSPFFDSFIAEGPPVFVQKTLFFLIRPLARAMGFRSYYEKYSMKRSSKFS